MSHQNPVPEDRCDLLCLALPLAEELRQRRPDERAVRRVAGGFRALADPTRLSVALALREGDELWVCDLAWILERAQNLTSHHLRARGRRGWSTTGARGRWRSTR